jgi:hypothetical protein
MKTCVHARQALPDGEIKLIALENQIREFTNLGGGTP